MKTMRVWMIWALIMLLLAGPVTTAWAQEGDDRFNCNGLSPDDCQILRDSAEMMRDVQAFDMPAWFVDLTIEVDGELVVLDTSGRGTLVLPVVWAPQMAGLPESMSVFALAPLLEFAESLDADLIAEAMSEFGLYFEIDDARLVTPDASREGRATGLIRDLGIYLHLFSPNDADAWFGEEGEMSLGDLAELQETLAELPEMLEDPEVKEGLAQLSEVSGSLGDLFDLLASHVSTTRLEDDTLHDQPVAVFETSLDLMGLLADPELATLLLRILQNPVWEGLDVDMEDLGDIDEFDLRILLTAVGLLLDTADFSMTQAVGLEDGAVHELALDFEINLDTEMMGEDAEFETLYMALDFAVEMDNFNEASVAAVSVPAEYHTLDDVDYFAVGGPGMILERMAVGESAGGRLTSDSDGTLFYALPLVAGESVAVVLESDVTIWLAVYGPDGFRLDRYTVAGAEPVTVTADTDGIYLLSVEGYGNAVYSLAVKAVE